MGTCDHAWLTLLLANSLTYRKRVDLLRERGVEQAAQNTNLTNHEARRLEASLQWLSAPDRHLICLDDARYPQRLLQIDSPPLALFAIGDLSQLAMPMVSIVGSRHCTALGETTANDFAAELNAQGICVVSGMARGIDTAAHDGALANTQLASTIAVLGTGINLCYPASNQKMYTRIAQRGCLISEYPLDYPPLRENFPRRNRIVAGMSQGVLIVEAARDSGSLITARQALTYGRDVFAIPGSIHSPTSKGCHQLLREGAILCESVDDILTALRWHQPELVTTKPRRQQVAPTDNAAWRWFGDGPISLDDLCARSGQALHVWLPQLGNWEMNGLIERTLDGRYQRAVI
jgi:DNA processing protein